jgi:DNA-binding XRE family transcriptional regulator
MVREKHRPLRERNPLYRFRIERAMSNNEIARLIGYKSVDGLLRLIRYENGPSLTVAMRIAKLLGCPLEDVLQDYAKNVAYRKRAA